MARWRQVDTDLTTLASALTELRKHPSVSPDDAAELTVGHLLEIRANIADVVDLYCAVQARFARETVNIGVSGSARVGKSTLLQAVSGLSDQQIPTGRDIPVTAVRSRIYHSPREKTAVLRLHSPESFIDEVIRPYHNVLMLNGVPASLDEFRSWNYAEANGAEVKAGDVALLVRLREMQQSLPSYEADLTGGEKVVKLEELRPYVAYPTSADRAAAGRVEHRYLAVKDVRIDCPFPYTDVDQLGIIDLPGLGEIAADAERQHVTGLRHDVDVVLLVKRAAEGMAYWSESDAQAVNLLDEARGFIRNRGDFVFIVVNTKPGDEDLQTALRADIQRQVNDNQPDKHFSILQADAADAESVRDQVLSPLLRTLTDRLPGMDEQCFSGAEERAAETTSVIRRALNDVSAALHRLRAGSAGAIEDLERRAKTLRGDVTVELSELVTSLAVQANSDEDDPDYVEAIDKAYRQVKDWIEGGFGLGREEWERLAYRSFLEDNNTVRYGGSELNRIRVEVSIGFSSLNDFFTHQIEESRRQVARILRTHFGALLDDVDIDAAEGGTAALTKAAGLLAEASEPCPTLEGAIRHMLSLRLEYRTQLQPKMRSRLNGLNIQFKDPITKKNVAVVEEPTRDGARDLYTYAYEQSRQAAWDTRQALLAEDITPLLVIYSSTEQFADTFIRAGDSETEFRRFARSYRDELWPGEFAGVTEGHARYAKVTRIISTISGELA